MRVTRVAFVICLVIAAAFASAQVTLTIDEALPPGEYVVSPVVISPPPEPDTEQDPDSGPEPDTDPDPMPSERPDLGPRGLPQNNAYKGPYVPAVSRMPSLKYLGGFTLDRRKFGVSSIASHKGGFSVTGDRLWITGNRNLGRDIGAFEVPALANDPKDSVARNVVPFFRLGGVAGQHLTNVFEWDGWLLASNTVFYDGSRSNKCYIIAVKLDGTNQQPCYNVDAEADEWLGQMAAGSFFKPPADMVDELGGTLCMHPEHWISIISRVSAGPGLHCFTPDFPGTKRKINLVPHMYYPHRRTVGQHGSSGLKYDEGEGAWKVAQGVSNPIFNRLARYEGCFLWPPTDSYICVGLNGGQIHGDWYGPMKNQPRTHVQRGTHTGHPDEMPQGRLADGWPKTPGKLRSLRDMRNYYWITPISEILAAERPWSPEPVEWGYFNQLLPSDERPDWIRGAFFDSNRLYLMTGSGEVRVYQVGA